MKLILILFYVIIGGALLAEACSVGCSEYQGACACDARPESAPEVVPSDEKPPRNRVPAYERGDVKADMGTRAPYLPLPDDQSGKIPNGGTPVHP